MQFVKPRHLTKNGGNKSPGRYAHVIGEEIELPAASGAYLTFHYSRGLLTDNQGDVNMRHKEFWQNGIFCGRMHPDHTNKNASGTLSLYRSAATAFVETAVRRHYVVPYPKLYWSEQK